MRSLNQKYDDGIKLISFILSIFIIIITSWDKTFRDKF